MIKSVSVAVCKNWEVLKFSITSLIQNDLAFKTWHFLFVLVSFFVEIIDLSLCADTDCEMSMINRIFLKKWAFIIEIKLHDNFITLRSIKANRHVIDQWIIISFFFKATTLNDKFVYVKIIRVFHVVNNLKTNVLLSMNFLVLKKVIIDLSKQRIIFDSCENVYVSCHSTARDNVNVRRDVRANKKQIVSLNTTARVIVSVKEKDSLSERDFIFESKLKEVYTYFVDFKLSFVSIKNEEFKSMIISRNQSLNKIIEYSLEETYSIQENNHSLTIRIHNQIIEDFVRTLDFKSDISRSATNSFMKIKSSSEITMYDEKREAHLIQIIANRYFRILENTENIINLSKSEWLFVSLSSNWQFTKTRLDHKIYLLEFDARALMNQKFDKLHEQRKIKWFTDLTSFAFSVFVVWRTVYVDSERKFERKRRVVIDIRDLNRIIVTNLYSISLQSDIVFFVRDCTQISVIDCSD